MVQLTGAGGEFSDLDRVGAYSSFQSDLVDWLSSDEGLMLDMIDGVRNLLAGAIEADQLSSRLSTAHGISGADAVRRMSVTGVLLQYARAHDSAQTLVDALGQLASTNDRLGTLLESHSDTLLRIFDQKGRGRIEDAISRAYSSILPYLYSAEATWDIRPATTEEGRVLAYAPVLILRLTTSAGSNDEVVVQMRPTEFHRFRQMLDSLDASLDGIAACTETLNRGAVHEDGDE